MMVGVKARYTAPCEDCKVLISTGSHFTRLHGRPWHYECARRYLARRKALAGG